MKPLCSILALLTLLTCASAQDTAFTYQGRLTDNGLPASGKYDLQLILFDHDREGSKIGGAGNFEDVSVNGGVFTVTFDPGPNVFTGAPRWLSIAVRPGASAELFTTLTPRQPVTTTPYAMRAASAATATTATTASSYTGPVTDNQLSANVARLNAANQTFSGQVNFSNAANVFSGSFNGSGAGLTQVPAAAVTVQNPPVLAWGLNQDGATDVPPNLTGVIGIAAGRQRSVALKADGSVVEWGSTFGGAVPPGLTGLTAIQAGDYHVVGLRQDGTVVVWGDNTYGQRNVPPGLTGITAIAAGSHHNLALDTNGRVTGWGRSNFGQTAIPLTLTNVIAIAAGSAHSVALRQNGTVVAWGTNPFITTVPEGLSGVVAIAANGGHTLALKNDGTVVAWGAGGSGQLAVPAGLNGVTAIAAGGSYSMALRQDGTLFAWGDNGYGQATPLITTHIAAMAGGYLHGLALRRPQSPASFVLSDRSNTLFGDQYLRSGDQYILGGNLAIGTESPTALLSLGAGILPTKLALYDPGPGTPSYGLGVQPAQFRLHVDSPDARFSFLNGPDGQELVSIKGNGSVGIGISNPQAKLDVAGSVRIGPGSTAINQFQTGNVFVGTHNTGVRVQTVNFPAPFLNPPRVLLTPRGENYSDVFAATTRSVTTTGFTMNIIRLDAPGAGWGQNLTVDWMATD